MPAAAVLDRYFAALALLRLSLAMCFTLRIRSVLGAKCRSVRFEMSPVTRMSSVPGHASPPVIPHVRYQRLLSGIARAVALLLDDCIVRQ